MDLTPYVDRLRHELMAAAETGGEKSLALADRLTTTMESAIRLTLLNVLSEAMDQVSHALAPASVAVRLHGLDPEFEVTTPAGQPPAHRADDVEHRESPAPGGHIRLQFPDARSVKAAAALFPTATSDPAARALYIPSDGGLPTLRAVLARLDAASLEAESLTAHTTALDDVFQTFNGCPLPSEDDRSGPTELPS
ncbi:hypothetical protein [Streptomyces sp. V4I8]|uniref:hypothetical protein n=1 Tax=Streptomyces sp. V4I8 TaxID=3156469 RepID=UPI003514F648